MNIGSLYKVKEYFWLLFPTKVPVAFRAARHAAVSQAIAAAAPAAAWYSKCFNCEVTYFPPDSIVVFLEDDGKYKKVLTSDGKIGWPWFNEDYNDCFEEVKTEK